LSCIHASNDAEEGYAAKLAERPAGESPADAGPHMAS
jgi:hypothetical protein